MKTPVYTWRFQSDSNLLKTYETLMYADGSFSCDCPGWTRRVDASGRRTCKHVRTVAIGDGAKFAVLHGSLNAITILPQKETEQDDVVNKPLFKRKFV